MVDRTVPKAGNRPDASVESRAGMTALRQLRQSAEHFVSFWTAAAFLTPLSRMDGYAKRTCGIVGQIGWSVRRCGDAKTRIVIGESSR